VVAVAHGAPAAFWQEGARMAETRVYIGGYAQANEVGLRVYRLNMASGALTCVHELAGVVNPSFFALSADGRHLYAVNEVAEFQGRREGGVSAFALDPATGAPALLNQQSSGGAGPCYVSLERTGRYALVANYGSGSVAMLPIRPDGGLLPASDVVQHEGRSVDPRRQAGPHAHAIVVDPGNAYAHAPDLGLDKVLCYRLDLAAGRLVPGDPPAAPVAAGAGPRHLAFHPHGRFAYVITEMGNTVGMFAYDAASGRLTARQTVATLPAGFTGTSYGADLHFSPDGRFLYGSNRGHDSLAVFAVRQATGELELLATPSCGGAFPRNFALDPSGAFLLCANQNSDNVVVFRRDARTGGLTPACDPIEFRRPVCVRAVVA